MTNSSAASWENKRTDETRDVEKVLREAGFQTVDAYRYNSASIRVRVIDSRFEGLPAEKRDKLVDPHLAKLPDQIQADIMTLLIFSPSELTQPSKKSLGYWVNNEFENPSPSRLDYPCETSERSVMSSGEEKTNDSDNAALPKTESHCLVCHTPLPQSGADIGKCPRCKAEHNVINPDVSGSDYRNSYD